MQNWFNSEKEAKAYKERHQLFARVPEKNSGNGKWMLIFPIKAHVTVSQPHSPKAVQK